MRFVPLEWCAIICFIKYFMVNIKLLCIYICIYICILFRILDISNIVGNQILIFQIFEICIISNWRWCGAQFLIFQIFDPRIFDILLKCPNINIM